MFGHATIEDACNVWVIHERLAIQGIAALLMFLIVGDQAVRQRLIWNRIAVTHDNALFHRRRVRAWTISSVDDIGFLINRNF